LETFANVVDERDSHTYRHSARVADHVAGLAAALGLPGSDVARLRWAGRLHDLGKIAVDSAVLNKPGALTADEWSVVRRHPRLSARLLRRFRFATAEARAVEYHHERFDGQGYYDIEPGSVPLAAHFLIVADSFDAMTSARPYREGMSTDEALDEIEAQTGVQFEPVVARAFVAYIRGEDPKAALTDAEKAQLRDVFARRRRVRAGQTWSGSAERAVLAAVVLALVSAGFGFGPGVAAGAAAALSAIALRQRGFRRARRLTDFLRTTARPRSRPDLVLQGVAARLAGEGDLSWAGIVRWNQQELDGRIDLSWGSAEAAPRQSPVMSWLLRDAEAESALLRVPAAELGCSGEAIAVSLRHDRNHSTFLLFVFASRVPRHAEVALGAVVRELELALKPGPRASTADALTAVA
jgi:putative nucleotidyltransferase with HDIG domain